jgi:hypothetical protein
MPKYRDIEERILANTVAEWNVELQSYCWLWIGSKVSAAYQDYGRISVREGEKVKKYLAHRFVTMFLKEEEIPPGYQVDHICRNGLCCAPDHLRSVTPKANIAFTWENGRRKTLR